MEQKGVIGAVVEIDHVSRVAEARRIATVVAAEEGVTDIGKAAIIASELATNLQQHAQRGELHITPLSSRGQAGIEILAIDRGPGISNLNECFRDGHSTAGTAGNGLGAVRRMSDEFDAYSEPGKGTVLMSRVWANPGAFNKPCLAVGLASRPMPGEDACGDAWGIRFGDNATLMMVADGLGHGLLAAAASGAALTAFKSSAEQAPAALLEGIHRALRSTRGAAVAIASLEFGQSRVRFSGVGNIAGTVLTPAKFHAMVSHNGTVGHEARHIQEFAYPLTPESIVVMHSDGLSGKWNLDASPGILHRHPSLISAVLYREAARDRDDACVIVGKNHMPERASDESSDDAGNRL
jgi:anti-sigma regulatory factor (Ser/Thr protein kinase)